MFPFVPVVGFEPLGAGKFAVVLAYSTRLYSDVETSLNDGIVLNQNGVDIDATSCQMAPPSRIVPPGVQVVQSGSVAAFVVPAVVQTKIRFVPVPETENVSNAVGMIYVPAVTTLEGPGYISLV
jgi:hypothetical protein